MASGSTNIKQEHVEEKTSPAELEPYVRLFHQHKGDLRAVFTVLGEDPGCVLKTLQDTRASVGYTNRGGGAISVAFGTSAASIQLLLLGSRSQRLVRLSPFFFLHGRAT